MIKRLDQQKIKLEKEEKINFANARNQEKIYETADSKVKFVYAGLSVLDNPVDYFLFWNRQMILSQLLIRFSFYF